MIYIFNISKNKIISINVNGYYYFSSSKNVTQDQINLSFCKFIIILNLNGDRENFTSILYRKMFLSKYKIAENK